MNSEQANSFARNMAVAVGAIAAFAGFVDNDTLAKLQGPVTAFVGSAIVLGGLVWSMYKNRTAGVIESAAGLDEVKQIKVQAETPEKTRKLVKETKRPEVAGIMSDPLATKIQADI